jgi:hypothetical protein
VTTAWDGILAGLLAKKIRHHLRQHDHHGQASGGGGFCRSLLPQRPRNFHPPG